MITVKEAVRIATAHLHELFPEATGVRLEEIEMADDGPWWDITLSFPQPGDSEFAAVVLASTTRAYKVVRLDRDSGEVHSIKIRKI